MINYIGKIFDDFPKPIIKSAPAPHNENLFKVCDENEATFLPDDQAYDSTKPQLSSSSSQCMQEEISRLQYHS